MRHAEAGDHDPSRWPDDSQRPLTEEGLKQARDAAKGLRRSGLRVTKIVSSPYARARQTAEAAARGLDYEGKIELARAMEPGGTPERLEKEIEKLEDGDRALFVGHEPSISAFMAALSGGGGLSVEFKKAAVCRLDAVSRAPMRFVLRWFLTPRLAARLEKKP